MQTSKILLKILTFISVILIACNNNSDYDKACITQSDFILKVSFGDSKNNKGKMQVISFCCHSGKFYKEFDEYNRIKKIYYLYNDNKEKTSVDYNYVNEDIFKYKRCWTNNKINGKEEVYFNNSLINECSYRNGFADGNFVIYDTLNEIQYSGLFEKGGLCYLNKYCNTKVENTNSFIEIFAQSENDSIYVYVDFVRKNYAIDSAYITYSFYRILDNLDSVNLNPNFCNGISVSGNFIKIPFTYKRNGKYIFKSSYYEIEGDHYLVKFSKLSFEFDKAGNLISEVLQNDNFTVELKYPYYLINQFTELAELKNIYDDLVKIRLPATKSRLRKS